MEHIFGPSESEEEMQLDLLFAEGRDGENHSESDHNDPPGPAALGPRALDVNGDAGGQDQRERSSTSRSTQRNVTAEPESTGRTRRKKKRRRNRRRYRPYGNVTVSTTIASYRCTCVYTWLINCAAWQCKCSSIITS